MYNYKQFYNETQIWYINNNQGNIVILRFMN